MLVTACYHGRSLLSRKINWETNSHISHVSFVRLPDAVWHHADGLRLGLLKRSLDTCPVWEAWGSIKRPSESGVRRLTGIDAGHTPGTRVELFRFADHIHVPEAAIVADLDKIVEAGTGYDWIGLLRYKFRSRRSNTSRMFCSELHHHVCINHNVWLIRRREPHRTAPGDIYISPILEPLWTITTGEKRINASEALENADLPALPEIRKKRQRHPADLIAEQISALPSAVTISGDGSGRALPEIDPFNPKKELFA